MNQLSEETSTRAELVVTGVPRQLPPASEECLLRVTQEALANVRKHADASRVTVTVSFLDAFCPSVTVLSITVFSGALRLHGGAIVLVHGCDEASLQPAFTRFQGPHTGCFSQRFLLLGEAFEDVVPHALSATISRASPVAGRPLGGSCLEGRRPRDRKSVG